MNKMILHIEGAFVLLASLYVYATLEFNWLLFLLLFFTPDLSMVGYALNLKVGSILYNLFHTYSIPLIGVTIGIASSETILMISLIWIAHIGFDRMIGYGLKYQSSFNDTHLKRV